MTTIKFECTRFESYSVKGGIRVAADIQDCAGVLRALAKNIGVDQVRQILSDLQPPKRVRKAVAKEVANTTLVNYLIPYDKIIEPKVPTRALDVYRKELRTGQATSLGKHPRLGFFVLNNDTQALLWCEK